MGELEGKVAVVTGGARGIGKQIAITLAKEGADIAIADMGDMSEAADQIKALGRRALTIKTNVILEMKCRTLLIELLRSLIKSIFWSITLE